MEGIQSHFNTGGRPADSLPDGLPLEHGWRVLEKIEPAPGATGGNFSVGYLVEHQSGRKGFLKALDFTRALQSPNPTDELQLLTSAYNFERDVALKCSDVRRVVTALSHGAVDVPGNFGLLGKVSYIIFEKAEGDIRTELAKLSTFDLAWAMRSLHHAAVAVSQIHVKQVAHQDMKPSNVFAFADGGFKIGDFGRASDAQLPSANDSFVLPGDPSYAPPEQRYQFRAAGDFSDRVAADLYLLGSLFFFFFLNVSSSQLLEYCVRRLGPSATLIGDFNVDVIVLQRAYGECIEILEKRLTSIGCGELTTRIARVAGEMCDPDPRTRGNRRIKSPCRRKYDVQRYASQINDIAERASLGML